MNLSQEFCLWKIFEFAKWWMIAFCYFILFIYATSFMFCYLKLWRYLENAIIIYLLLGTDLFLERYTSQLLGIV